MLPWKLFWRQFAQLVRMVKDSPLALFGAVVTIAAGILFALCMYLGSIIMMLYHEREVNAAAVAKDMAEDRETIRNWADSSNLWQSKFKNLKENIIVAPSGVQQTAINQTQPSQNSK